jgi:phosphoglycerol transferase MdoB-like AlkP superfamily enzyme
MYTNITYHSFFEGYLHINQYIGLFSEGFDLAKHAAVPSHSFNWFLLIDAPFFIGIIVLYSRVSSLNKRYIHWKSFFVLSAILIFMFWKADFIGSTEKRRVIMDDRYSSDNDIVYKYGLLAYNIVDLFKYRDTRLLINSLDYGRKLPAVLVDSTHPNFVIIQVESMDASAINLMHKKSYVMPFLHSVSKKAVYYPYTMSYHKGGSTSDCEFSIINSVEPFDDYPAMKLRDYDYPNSMLKPLRAARYDVLAFHGNRGSYFNRDAAFTRMGFKKFYDLAAMGLQEKGWGASDGDLFDYVKNKLRDQNNPFFYYIITMTSHEPFTLARSYYKNVAYDDIRDVTARNYYFSMSYVDGELKRFVRYIRDSVPDTYIIIYGDHTPPIVENRTFKRAAFADKDNLFEFVPLLILTPDAITYQERKRIASFADIAPTLLPAA